MDRAMPIAISYHVHSEYFMAYLCVAARRNRVIMNPNTMAMAWASVIRAIP